MRSLSTFFTLVIALDSTAAQRPGERVGFVTTLGRDTVALESYQRTGTRTQGKIVLRVPNTVLFHYVIDRHDDGSLSRSWVEIKPLANAQSRRRVTIDFRRDSARVVIDSAGASDTTMRGVRPSAAPILTTGFGSSFGIYTAIGMLQDALAHLPLPLNDTAGVPAIGVLTGRAGSRQIVRRSSTMVDLDFFRIAWAHLTVDAEGRIVRVDASETTEKTIGQRAAPMDIAAAAKDYAARDAAGRGIGVASPPDSTRATLGVASVVVSFSSPRLRGRLVLGEAVPYDKVWRTGANVATVLHTDHDLVVGGTPLPAGMYSLWTLPHHDGVELIINRQHGQWGTEYNAARDFVRLPMRVSRAATSRENFAIRIAADGREGALRIEWGEVVWSISLNQV